MIKIGKPIMLFIFFSNIVIAQINGSFDPEFNNSNTLYLYVPNPDEKLNDIAVQSDLKTLAVGYSQGLLGDGYNYSFTVFRINEDGTLDGSFGNAGLVLFGEGIAEAVEALEDGQILVAGNMNEGVALTKLNADGTLKADFGVDGISIIPMSTVYKTGTIYSMKVLSTGKILLTGYLSDGVNKQVLIISVNTDGTVDSEFGINGYIEKTIESKNEEGNYILEQDDGKIIILGQTNSYLFVSRFNSDGSDDTSFGNEGFLITELRNYQFDDDKFKGRLQSDGEIVIAGYMPDPNNAASRSNYAAVRIKANGELDTSFGTDGYVNVDFDNSQSQDWAHDVLISPEGIILLGGSYLNSNNFANLGILALDSDGNVLPSFENNGRGSALGNSILALRFDNNMNIVAGGLSTQNKGYTVARFLYTENAISVDDNNFGFPDEYDLSQNFPNPFNRTTTIKYSVPVGDALNVSPTPVLLKIFDIIGNEIPTLVNETKSPGTYEVTFDASHLSSGVCFYKLSS